MEIIILPTPAEVGGLAARKIAQVITRRPEAVVGLATGSSPLAIYAELAAQVEAGTLDARRVRGVALDEYVGIPADHPESYRSVITRQVTQPLGLDPRNVFVPDGRADRHPRGLCGVRGDDPSTSGVSTSRSSASGPTVTSASTSPPRRSPRAPGSRPWPRRPGPTTPGSSPTRTRCPTHCLTQGLGTIMDARELLLVAQGEAKAAAIAAAVEGPVTSMCPGSILQFHPQATVIIDEAAAGEPGAGRLLPAHLREQARQRFGERRAGWCRRLDGPWIRYARFTSTRRVARRTGLASVSGDGCEPPTCRRHERGGCGDSLGSLLQSPRNRATRRCLVNARSRSAVRLPRRRSECAARSPTTRAAGSRPRATPSLAKSTSPAAQPVPPLGRTSEEAADQHAAADDDRSGQPGIGDGRQQIGQRRRRPRRGSPGPPDPRRTAAKASGANSANCTGRRA